MSFKNRINSLMGKSCDFVNENKKELFAGAAVASVATILAPVYGHMAMGELPANSLDMIKTGATMAAGSLAFAATPRSLFKKIGDKLQKDPLAVLNKAGEKDFWNKDGKKYLQKQVGKMNMNQRQMIVAAAEGVRTLNMREDSNYHTDKYVKGGSKLFNEMNEAKMFEPEKKQKFAEPGMAPG